MRLLKICIYLVCVIVFTGCSTVSTNNIHTVTDDPFMIEPREIEDIAIEEHIPLIEFNKVDTSDYEISTNNEYSFKYNSDIWNEIEPYDYDENSVGINIVLQNDVATIIGGNLTYLSNTTSSEYIELLIASIPDMPLTGVEIVACDFQTIGNYDIALIETKAGFTKEDINDLIYDQIITHENVNAIGGVNFLDYKPILTQFSLIICDDTNAYTFVSSFETNSNSQNFNNYYRGIILDAFDSIVQTLTTDIRYAEF